MDLSVEEIEAYIKLISSGKKFINIDGVDLIFKQPDMNLKMKGDYVRERAYDRAVGSGLLPLNELEDLIDKRNIITPEEKEELKKLESRLEGQKAILNKTKKVQSNVDRVRKIVDDLENRINEIKYKRLSKISFSADVKAEEEKYVYLCRNSVYDFVSEDLYWQNERVYNSDKNYKFKQRVLDEYVTFLRGLSTDVIRYLARNNLWRVRYITSVKSAEDLFGVPTSNYTDDMLNLTFWSNYYQNIYEMLPEDRPSDQIIEDDEALDAYMASYHEEKEKESLARKGSKKYGNRGKMSAFNNEEVIVTRSNDLYENLNYDKPREAQRVKDRPVVANKKKRRKRR